MPPTGFGGSWTLTKLEILRSYLDRYTTALKDKPFRLIYVDAFAGSGFWSPRSVHDPDTRDFREMWDGSATLALTVDDRQFDRLIFIEKDEARCSSLQQLASIHTDRDVRIANKDANEAIPTICRAFRPYDRAVVFLDPFATQLSWSTVEALAGTKIVDCWILFPLGAVVRLMPLKHDPKSVCRLDSVFGGRQHWHSLYQSAEQLDLFGEQNVERSGGNEKVIDLYRERLESVFEKVAPTRRILRNSKNAPLFALYFAASNKRGASIAVRIADHLLTKW